MKLVVFVEDAVVTECDTGSIAGGHVGGVSYFHIKGFWIVRR